MVKERNEERAKEIGARIALARREADGMTQRELADLIGVTERSVAAYEAGDVIPYRFMRQLQSLLNRPVQWILYGEESTVDPELRHLIKANEDLAKAVEELIAKLK